MKRSVKEIVVRLLILLVGLTVAHFGVTLFILASQGIGPNDLVSVITVDKLGRKFSIVRIAADTLFVLTGWLLGGAVGLGTVVCVALVDPVAGLFLPINGKWIGKVIEKV